MHRPRAAAAFLMAALTLAPALVFVQPAAAASTAPLELIVAPDSFVSALVPLKAWRETQGLRVDIVTTTYIQSQFPAYDLPESINQYIGARYASDQSLKYVLLAADDPIIPGRVLQVANRSAGGPLPPSDRALVSDYYYALPGNSWINTSDRGDDYPVGLTWFGITDSNWSLAPVLSVGRIPATTPAQLSDYVARLLSWEQSPPTGLWQSRVITGMAVASVPDAGFGTRRAGDDAGVAFSTVESKVAAAGLVSLSLHDYPHWPSPYDPLADQLNSPAFLGEWNLGASLAVLAARDGPSPFAPGDAYAGDGSSSVFTSVAPPAGLEVLDNGDRLPIFIAAYGSSANLSMDNDTNVERALFAPNGGAAAVFGFAGRTGAGTQPGAIQGGWSLAAALADEIVSNPGRAGDVMERARARFVADAQSLLGSAFDANNASLRRAFAGLTLLGDPGMLVRVGPARALTVDFVGGVAPNATAELAVRVTSGGAPVANASIAILDDSGDLRAACTTDAEGNATCTVTTGARATWSVHVSAGGFSMASAPLEVDTPPTVAIIMPGEGTSIAGRLNFTGTAGDPDAGDTITAVEVAVNGGPWAPALGNASWSYDVDTGALPNGPNAFAARASDGVVWSLPRTVHFTVTNPKPPVLLLPYPVFVLDEDVPRNFSLDLTGHFQLSGGGATLFASANTSDRLAVSVAGENLSIAPAANFTGYAVVTLTVVESYGGARALLLSVYVTPVDDPPQLTVNSNLTVEEGGTVNFDPRAFDPDGTPFVLYVEDGPAGATPTGWTAPRGSAGTVEIVLAVSDGRYIARATVIVTVTSHNFAPTGRLAAPTLAEAGREVSFEAQAIADQDGDPVTVSWDFGDGQTAQGGSVTHVYAAPGNYVVRLTLDDGPAETVLEGTIRIDPYRPPAAAASPIFAVIGWASIAVIMICSVLATYLLFFSRGAMAAPGRPKGRDGEEE